MARFSGRLLQKLGIKVPRQKKKLRTFDTSGCSAEWLGDHVRVQLPLPPTLNNYRVPFRGRLILSPDGRAWKKACEAIRYDGPKMSGALEVTITLFAPDHRRRDLDNFLKPCLDMLTTLGIWADDSQIDKLTVGRGMINSKATVSISVKRTIDI